MNKRTLPLIVPVLLLFVLFGAGFTNYATCTGIEHANVCRIDTSTPGIDILSIPPTTGTVGTPYTYDVDAQSTQGTITYLLLDAPHGANIDGSTGVVTYTTNKSGYADFSVRAEIANDPMVFATQTWRVYFGGDSTRDLRQCVWVYGVVRDQNGDPNVYSGKIYGYPGPPRQNPHSVRVADIQQDGSFALFMGNPGEYYFEASPGGRNIDFEAVYYPNTKVLNEATVFDTECGDELELNFFVNMEQQTTEVKFRSKPPKYGETTQPYTYYAQAYASNNAAVKYSVVKPATATVNETSGYMEYIPPQNAPPAVDFELKAELAGDPTIFATQTWSVTWDVDSADNCAHFRGSIVDQNGYAITEGTVTAAFLGSASRQPRTFQLPINKYGTYDGFGLFAGNYILSVSGPHFPTVWYDGASSEQRATPVSIKCNEAKICNFVVAPNGYKTISGTVLSDSGYAVGAHITAKDIATNEKYYGLNNLSGAYTMYVPENITVTVLAQPKYNDWFEEYYNEVPTETQATNLLIDGNKSDINFTLERRPVYQNTLSGTTRGAQNNGVHTVLRLFRVVTNGTAQSLQVRDDVGSDGLGNFSFINIPPGDYVIKAKNVPQDYAPCWYKENAEAVLAWQDATQITVTETGSVTGLDFLLDEVNGIQGTHDFFGMVNADVTGFMSGTYPVEDAQVTLVDAGGDISNYATTDAEGKYAMENIAAGTYTLVTDHPLYQSLMRELELTFNGNDPLKYDITLNTQGTTAIGNVPTAASFQATLYPNPVQSEVNLRFSGEPQTLTMRLFNQLGEELLSREVQVSGPVTGTSMSTASLPAGNYHITLTGSGSHSVLHFTKIR